MHTPLKQTLAAIALLVAAAVSAAPERVFTDDFERKGTLPWRQTWGPAGPSTERARSGTTGIKETLENKHGLSVW